MNYSIRHSSSSLLHTFSHTKPFYQQRMLAYLCNDTRSLSRKATYILIGRSIPILIFKQFAQRQSFLKMTTSEIQFVADEKTQMVLQDDYKGPEKMAFINGKTPRGLPFKKTIKAVSLGDIMNSEFGYSVLIKLEKEDVDSYTEYEDLASHLIPDGFTMKENIKDDKLFLRLHTKDDKFKASFDPPVTPSLVDKAPLHQGSELDITFQPNIWINFETKQGGIYLTVFNIVIDGGKKRVRRRQ